MTRASSEQSEPNAPAVATTTTAEPIEPLLTAAELAVIARVHVRTIRRWHELGEIPAGLRIGAVVRWRRDEIEAFLRNSGKPGRRGQGK